MGTTAARPCGGCLSDGALPSHGRRVRLCRPRQGRAPAAQGSYPSIAWRDQLLRPEHPVVCVSWHDALACLAWLTAITSQPWRLPTEAEREKATSRTRRAPTPP